MIIPWSIKANICQDPAVRAYFPVIHRTCGYLWHHTCYISNRKESAKRLCATQLVPQLATKELTFTGLLSRLLGLTSLFTVLTGCLVFLQPLSHDITYIFSYVHIAFSSCSDRQLDLSETDPADPFPGSQNDNPENYMQSRVKQGVQYIQSKAKARVLTSHMCI